MSIKSLLLFIMGTCAGIVLLAGCGGPSEKASASDQPVEKKEAGKDEKAKKTIETDVVYATTSKIPGGKEFVLINLGTKDKVKIGQEFTITRGRTYICNVVITKVYDTSSIGRIIPESLNRDKKDVLMKPQKGDKAKLKYK